VKAFVTVPARINILGNPTDGNEGDFYTISAAINIYGGAIVEPAKRLTFRYVAGPASKKVLTWSAAPRPAELRVRKDDSFSIFAATLRGLMKFHPPARALLDERPVCASLWTKVPRQSGLGGSSVLVLALLNALRAYYGLDRAALHDYALAELTQRIEEREMGVTCGYADRYVPQLGGLAYIDYRDKLHHRPIGREPLATYERLDPLAQPPRFIIGFSGIRRESGDVHSVMRGRYLADWERQQRRPAFTSTILERFEQIGETARGGKVCLLRGDLAGFGRLMNRNHALMNAIMRDCGFAAGAGELNNRLIKAALQAGALGAKLSGAGGGGSVLILPEPGGARRVLAGLRAEARRGHMRRAKFFTVRVVRHGPRVTIEE
jgi:galactokinase/mevalonate kinase-like predicted kinase